MSTATFSLGLIEVYSLSVAIYVADQAVKLADVSIAGIEGSAGTDITIKLIGDAANVKRAVDAGKAAAESMNAKVVGTTRLNFEESSKVPMVHTKQEYSPINEGNLHMLPHEVQQGARAM